MKKIYANATEALDGLLHDGMLIASGGFGLCGIPELLLEAIRSDGEVLADLNGGRSVRQPDDDEVAHHALPPTARKAYPANTKSVNKNPIIVPSAAFRPCHPAATRRTITLAKIAQATRPSAWLT